MKDPKQNEEKALALMSLCYFLDDTLEPKLKKKCEIASRKLLNNIIDSLEERKLINKPI